MFWYFILSSLPQTDLKHRSPLVRKLLIPNRVNKQTDSSRSLALARAPYQPHADGLTFSSTLHPKLEHGVACGLACRVWCMSISGKLKTDWYWQEHKSPHRCLLYNLCGCQATKETLKCWPCPDTAAKVAVGD